jgi:hypothetical protein
VRKEDATRFFINAYEERDEYRNEVKYNLKIRESAEGDLMKKIQQMGRKKLLSLKLDTEEILGYTNLFIYEALLEYDGNIDDECLNDYVSLYCYDRYNKLSRDSGVNYDYYYDKCSGKYELIKTCELLENVIEDANNKDMNDADNDETVMSDAEIFISTYINEEYLTPKQIEYCLAVLEYGPSKGVGIKDLSGKLLYTKQKANYYNNEIRARLAEFLVQDRQ